MTPAGTASGVFRLADTYRDLVIKVSLAEDLGPDFDDALDALIKGGTKGLRDVTTDAIFGGETGEAFVVAKSEGVLSGSLPFRRTFGLIDPGVAVDFLLEDGGAFRKGDRVASVKGKMASLLRCERTALNFLGHLSGVATAVNKLARLLEGSGVSLLDTRKTLPCMRALEKSAVLHGGGKNHRMGLHDMVLIKDNHIDGAGSVAEAVRRVRAVHGGRFRVEVEARDLNEVREALSSGVDRIMLDNMGVRRIREAALLARGRVEVEVSGNLNASKIRRLRKLPIDFVSVGSVTHSAPQADFSMQVSFPPGR